MSKELITVCDLKRGDVVETDGKRLVYHGYATRRGSKLWQLQFTHEVGGGLFLWFKHPSDKVARPAALKTK